MCQHHKAKQVSPTELLQPLLTRQRIWEDISIDFAEGLFVSKGQSNVLVHFIPLSHPYTATVVAQIFFDQVFKSHGMSITIVCGFVGHCYNTSWQSAIKTTPFEVVYGRPPPSLLMSLRATLKEAQNRMKKVYDYHHREREFEEGDWLSPRYYGPYQIVKKIRVIIYKLDLLEESRIHPVFHVSMLKKKVGEGTMVQTELPPMHESDVTLHPKPQALIDQRIHTMKKQILIH
ncbi:hypothetical protein AMTRI_Chr12g269400 [Amborella trichopoda]